MQIADFKRIVTTFADPDSELLFDQSRVLIEVNSVVIDVSLTVEMGEVFVIEGETKTRGEQWIVKRLARLPLLADRLLNQIKETEAYISPAAQVLKSLEVKPDDKVEVASDALKATIEAVDNSSPMETTVLYITSDAGEGKTSLINQMARTQAQKFKSRESSWLLVPIPLGGRNFLRFDDIVVGALANRYRFTNFYYASFLELVRMRVIVPAFDGFEEMFVENSSGEAISAMGTLVNQLDSQGVAIVAARTAYFEFQNLKTQAKLYDSLRSFWVGFGKVGIERWTKRQFLEYCVARGLEDAESLYEKVAERLGESHPLVTRPVLATRLVDIAKKTVTLDEFLLQLSSSGPDFFTTFVRGIIEREANEKWIYRSGDLAQPLLTVDQHIAMLAQIALEMWHSRVDFLKSDMLEFVADYFSEVNRMSATQSTQVKERLKGHALLVVSTNAAGAYEFDHDEFRQYFLGEAVAKMCFGESNGRQGELLNALRRASLPQQTIETIIHAFGRVSETARKRGIKLLRDTALLDGQTSFTHENCASLILPLLSSTDSDDVELFRMAFPYNSLRDRTLSETTFKECYFADTSLEQTRLENCIFRNCHFNRIEVFDSTGIDNVMLIDCIVESVHVNSRNQSFFEPESVNSLLDNLGFKLTSGDVIENVHTETSEKDPELVQVEKLVRYFSRSTHIGENVILIKLGEKGQAFLDEDVPELLRKGILVEIHNRGRGSSQRRFKLGRPMVVLQNALEECGGSFEKFVEIATSPESYRSRLS